MLLLRLLGPARRKREEGRGEGTLSKSTSEDERGRGLVDGWPRTRPVDVDGEAARVK
jgi:hypothetical protein